MIETPVRPVPDDPPMPFVDHLIELRRRLIASVAILAAGTVLMFRFSGPLLSWLARPAGQLVFIAPTEAFYTRLKVALYGGFILAFPLLVHQAWLFGARALDRRLRRMLLAMVPFSYLLFLLGVAICLYGVVPAAMKFLLSYGSEQVRPMMSLSAYLEFVTGLSLAFGAVFQMPLVLYALNRMGIVGRRRLAEFRRHVYLLCFVAAAFLTPGPDVFSQVCLALPAVLLFEASLLAMS